MHLAGMEGDTLALAIGAIDCAYSPFERDGFLPEIHPSLSVFLTAPGAFIDEEFFAYDGVLEGVWGKHTAHFVTVFGYGALRYKHLGHHMTVCPYFSDDLVAQKEKTFCDMRQLRLFL